MTATRNAKQARLIERLEQQARCEQIHTALAAVAAALAGSSVDDTESNRE